MPVPARLDYEAERRVARRTEGAIRYFAAHPGEIDSRLRELDREWDIDRATDMLAATLGAVGAVYSVTRGRHWLLLLFGVAGLLGQQAVTGDSAPRRAMRRLGLRTSLEIEGERGALRALRSDYERDRSAAVAEAPPSRP